MFKDSVPEHAQLLGPTIILMYGIQTKLIPLNLDMVMTIPVDEAGRVVIPKRVRKMLGIAGEDILSIEVRGSEVVLKRSGIERSPAKAIAKMNLPAGPWDKVEREIEEGASSGDRRDV